MRRVSGTRQLGAPTLATALAVALLTGCATSHRVRGADKAGGSDAPLVLRLGDVDTQDDPNTTWVLEYFGNQVAKLSGGKLRVRVIYDAAGHERPDVEAQVARKVRDGSFDLGWIGAAVWDELGTTSFQALHAPFLVTDDVLLDRVATGPLAGSMLSGLRHAGVRGLAVVPESLRNPVGLRRPLVSLGSFRGARLIVTPSRVTDAALRVLGATPVHRLGKADKDVIRRGQADGRLDSLVSYFGPDIVTANVSFFPTLHAGRDRPVLLDRPQRLRHRRRSRRAREQGRARGPGACDATRLLRARARSPHEDSDRPDPSAQPIAPSCPGHPRPQRLLGSARARTHGQHGTADDHQARRDLPLAADEGRRDPVWTKP